MEIILGDLLGRKFQEQDGDVCVSPAGGQPACGSVQMREGKFSILNWRCSALYPEYLRNYNCVALHELRSWRAAFLL